MKNVDSYRKRGRAIRAKLHRCREGMAFILASVAALRDLEETSSNVLATRVVVGALIAMAVTVPCLGTEVVQVQKLTASTAAQGNLLGQSVAIDGKTLVAGAPGTGEKAVVFQSDVTGQWSETATLTPGQNASINFGWSTAVGGNTIVVSDPFVESGQGAGIAYVFEGDGGGNWNFKTTLRGSDSQSGSNFGFRVAVDNDRILVGEPHDDFLGTKRPGAAYLFERNQLGEWQEVAKLAASNGVIDDRFGRSVALSGNRAIVGAPFDEIREDDKPGAAYLFERDATGQWNEVAKLTSGIASQDFFGISVDIDSDRAIVGKTAGEGFGTQTARIFERNSMGQWLETAAISPFGGKRSEFGWSVAISGSLAMVGSRLDDSVAAGGGAAYLFRRNADNSWTPLQKIFEGQPTASAHFGWELALENSLAVVGSRGSYEGPIVGAGAAYVFKVVPEPLSSNLIVCVWLWRFARRRRCDT